MAATWSCFRAFVACWLLRIVVHFDIVLVCPAVLVERQVIVCSISLASRLGNCFVILGYRHRTLGAGELVCLALRELDY